ncbi:MAG: hypothetical protein M1838_000937 [Thelocarpon superellum]|nr:MAG: hypothetical protein M1838_000937 [Thelocarpon superellum]
MGDTDVKSENGQVEQTDRKGPMFAEELTHVPDPMRRLLEEYSGIPPDEVEAHIKQVRERAWKIWPYRCIGRFTFLDLSISWSAAYGEVLERVKAGQSLLDIGCCVGQDIRKLIFDGAPAEHLYGSDLAPAFFDVGFDLFRDRDRLPNTFRAADVFDPESSLKGLQGELDIIHIASVLHLFDWDGQIKLVRRLVQLLRSQKGSLVLGRQAGNVEPGLFASRSAPNTSIFRHDPSTFEQMWKQVGLETGTSWHVEATLGPLEGFSRYTEPGEQKDNSTRRLHFIVRRE